MYVDSTLNVMKYTKHDMKMLYLYFVINRFTLFCSLLVNIHILFGIVFHINVA